MSDIESLAEQARRCADAVDAARAAYDASYEVVRSTELAWRTAQDEFARARGALLTAALGERPRRTGLLWDEPV